MSSSTLHVVAFDIPCPPDYGGVIEVFFKIKKLHEQGIHIFLHCFYSKRKPDIQLEKYCEKVFYYKRTLSLFKLLRYPYIVASRSSASLLKNISATDAPVLFEGLHTCFFLDHPALRNRKKIVRIHNIEHRYYMELAKATNDLFKRIYYFVEAIMLWRFQKKLKHANLLLCISPSEKNYYSNLFKNTPVIYLPPFAAYERVESVTGEGDYVLYHGNLSVAENERACKYLINHVAHQINMPLVVAGKNPSSSLMLLCKKKNIRLIANPDNEQLKSLVQNAHINIVFSFQATGSKLKLFTALSLGRHCITMSNLIDDKLEKTCVVAQDKQQLAGLINEVSLKPFDQEELNKRKKILSEFFNEQKATLQLIMES